MAIQSKKITGKKIIDHLSEFQNQMCDDDFVKSNINFWPLVKVRLSILLNTNFNSSIAQTSFSSQKRRNKSRYLYLFDFRFWKDLIRLYKIKGTYLFITNSSNYRIQLKDSLLDIYLGPLQHLITESKVTLEYNNGRVKKICDENILIDGLYFISYSISKVIHKLYFFGSLFLPKKSIEKLVLYLKKHDIYKEDFLFEIDYLSIFLYVQSRIIKVIFLLFRPKSVVLSDWYSITNMSFILAANELGIANFDIQHGAQSNGHAAYADWRSGSKLIPKYFWVWSEADKFQLEKNLKSSAVFVGGIPVLGIFDSIRNNLSIDIASDFDLLDEMRLIQGKRTVLVTLQTDFELDQRLIDFVENNACNYFFLFRNHPCSTFQIENLLIKLSDHSRSCIRYEAVLCSKLPLVLVLSCIDFHVTLNSSTVIEAAAFQKRSLVLDQDLGSVYFEDYIKSGNVIFIDNFTLNKLDDLDKKQSLNKNTTDHELLNKGVSTLVKLSNSLFNKIE